MTFSDEDLEELKELTKASLYWSPKIPALLARLEAGESLNGYANHTYHCGIFAGGKQCECGFDRAHDKWHKAKGE